MEFLKSKPVKGHTILIKGSRGIRLERIYDVL
jgi:UDP-N-acetylmuramyl pentapeptide synthase